MKGQIYMAHITSCLLDVGHEGSVCVKYGKDGDNLDVWCFPKRRGTGAEGIVGHNERAQTDLCDMNTWNSSVM